MASSHSQQLNEIIGLIRDLKPSRILDIGTGNGKYGFLAREYLELPYRRLKKHEWRTKIDGIEVFKECITPVHNYCYNNIYIGDALDIISSLKRSYDLVLLIDILEHFEYEDGVKLIEILLSSGNKILVSTPKDIGPEDHRQGASFNNKYQIHRFQWKMKHFKKLGRIFKIGHWYSYIVYIGSDAKELKRAYTLRKLDNKIPFLGKYRFFTRIGLKLNFITLKLRRI